MIECYSAVRLLSDRFEGEGAQAGMIGYIVEVYDDGAAYEVEFSDTEGRTLAMFSIKEEDLEVIWKPGDAATVSH